MTQQQKKKYLWDNNDDWYHNKIIEWYDGYRVRKGRKAQIKKDLMPIAWHPSRHWDWFMSENEKKDTEKFWA